MQTIISDLESNYQLTLFNSVKYSDKIKWKGIMYILFLHNRNGCQSNNILDSIYEYASKIPQLAETYLIPQYNCSSPSVLHEYTWSWNTQPLNRTNN